MFSERIAEALAGTQSIAIVGDTAKDMLYASAVSWGFQLISANASEIATFEQNQTASFSKSAGHWLVVLEGADLMENDHEDTLLDLFFDGSATLTANTLIAVHFSQYCDISEALLDVVRSEERRVGKECVSKCRSRLSTYH